MWGEMWDRATTREGLEIEGATLPGKDGLDIVFLERGQFVWKVILRSLLLVLEPSELNIFLIKETVLGEAI